MRSLNPWWTVSEAVSVVIGGGGNSQSLDCGRYGVKSVKGWDLRLERLEIGSRENGDF